MVRRRMNKRNLQNEKLDRIGRKLLDAGRMRNEEIERIVASPMLFEAVKARIETERRQRNSKSVFSGWAKFQIWNWQKITAAVSMLFIVGAIGLIGFDKFSRQKEVLQVAAPVIQPKIEQLEMPPLSPKNQTPEDSPLILKTKLSAVESPKIAKQKVFTGKKAKAQKSNGQRKLPFKQEKPSGDFYALAFAENSGENGEELRVVRTELSRSSLFALGVNLPIENDSEKIKTDLLVGTDGVARAIRFVD